MDRRREDSVGWRGEGWELRIYKEENQEELCRKILEVIFELRFFIF